VRRAIAVRSTAGCAVAVLVVAVQLGGCGDGKEPKEQQSTGPNLYQADLWLSFEDPGRGPDGTPVFTDAAGGSAEGKVVSADGGSVELVDGPDGTGTAVAFPEECPAGAPCPRAMVEVPYSEALDPGDHDFTYGATVWLDASETSKGSNIVQAGRFGTDGGQWKLQVDGDKGEPSCVVRGDQSGAEPLVVNSHVSIADGHWHHVVCRRDTEGVSIEVDGEEDGKAGATGSVSSQWPIRVGAPGVGQDDDQFHGRVDDVFLLIDRS
jgi:hypothetical protein